VNITALANSGAAGVAESLKKLTEAVAGDEEISSEQKSELLDQLNELSSQATAAPERRAKLGVIKAVVTGLGSGLSSVANLAQVWSVTGDVICSYFGVENPFKAIR
jgi:uncharacterized protein (DUF697 family)